MRYILLRKGTIPWRTQKHMTFTRKAKFPKAPRKGGSPVVVKDKERQRCSNSAVWNLKPGFLILLWGPLNPRKRGLYYLSSKHSFYLKTLVVNCYLRISFFTFKMGRISVASPPPPSSSILTFSGDLSFSGGVTHLWGIDFVASERSV